MANSGKGRNSVVAIFSQHSAAENALQELKNTGFDIEHLSIIGRAHPTEQNIVGFHNPGDRMEYWGKLGAFWGGIWGLLVGAAVLIIPAIGPVVIAGSAVTLIVAALEGAIAVGGLSALGAGLFSLGIPKDSVIKYETSVKAGKFVLIAPGDAAEAEKARAVLQTCGAEQVNVHAAAAQETQAT